MINPVNKVRITSKFGIRTLNNVKKFHSGIDFAPVKVGIIGDDIFAVLDGTVCRVGNDIDGYGKYVILKHSNLMTMYAHLSTVDVDIVQEVKQGAIIGKMGNTGHCVGSGKNPGTHLHFEVRDSAKLNLNEFFSNESDGRKYKAVDPEIYLNKEKEDNKMEKTKYEIEIEEAKKYVIKNGISDGENGKETVTREQLWVMLYRLSKIK